MCLCIVCPSSVVQSHSRGRFVGALMLLIFRIPLACIVCTDCILGEVVEVAVLANVPLARPAMPFWHSGYNIAVLSKNSEIYFFFKLL